MRLTIKYIIVLSCLLVANIPSLFAAKEKTVASLSGADIAPLVESPATPYSLVVQDQKYNFIIANPGYWPCRFGIKNSRTSVVLRFDDSKKNVESGDWSLNITYNIKLYNATSSLIPYITYKNQTASISYNKAGDNNYSDVFLKTYEGALKAEVIIVDVNYAQAGLSGLSIPAKYNNDIYFDVVQETERYYNMSYNGVDCNLIAPSSPIIKTPVVPVLLDQSILQPYNNQLPVTWNFVEGAESYDVEWLFVDVPETSSGSTNFNGTYTIDFANATRVNVPDQHFEIPMAYPRGIIVFRVRAVATSYTAPFEKRVEGPWSIEGTTFMVSGSTVSGLSDPSGALICAKLYLGLDASYNWQYSAVYAEDGKHKEVISYFDGSLRNRQTATVLNADDNAVIAETKYDFQGRPAVQMLPTPYANSGIHYYTNFNPNFSKEEFDADGNYTSLGAIATVPSTDKTGAYYGNNSSATGSDMYTPDAQGVPYTQTRFKTDGTGRVVAQSGVGPVHMLGKGHDTRYYYGTPSGQEELDRLFGNEVGNVSHYKKNLTVDANGQVSVSYLDQEGRVIATALAGNEPDNLLPIDGKPEATEMVSDILTGKNILSGNSRVSKTAVLTSVPNTAYTFNYSLNWDSTCISYVNPLDPADPNLCKICETCVFDLEIRILDEDGNNLSGASYTGSSTGAYKVCSGTPSGGVAPVIRCKNIETANYAVNVTFPDIGAYYIEKILTISQKGIQNATSTFTNAVKDPPCGPFTVAAEAPPCNSCTDVCDKQYGVVAPSTDITTDKLGNPLATLSSGEIELANKEYQNCVNACNGIKVMDECELKALVLTQDMSPGGQYFDNIQDLVNSCSSALTCNPATPGYNESYCLNGWLEAKLNTTAFWTSFHTYLTDPANASCRPAGLLSSEKNWAFIRANWNPCFAKFLVQFHPEYSNLKFYCGNMQLCDYCPPGGDGPCGNTVFIANPEGSVGTTLVSQITMSNSNLYDKVLQSYNMPGSANFTSPDFNNPLYTACPASPSASQYMSNLAVSPALYTSITMSAQFRDPFFYAPLVSGEILCKKPIMCSAGGNVDVTALMGNYLHAFYTANTGGTPVPMSIWYVLDDPDNIRNPLNTTSTPFNSFRINGGTTTYFDQATLDFFRNFHSMFQVASPPTKTSVFRTAYIGYKDFLKYGLYHTNYNASANTLNGSYITQALPVPDPNEPGFTSCSYNLSTNSLPRAQIRFMRNEVYDMMLASCPDFKPSLGAIAGFTNNATGSGCESACAGKTDAMISDIKTKISACNLGAAASGSLTVLDNLKTDLNYVCILGCDATHLQGQSSVLTENGGLVASGDNFEQVINTYLNVAPYNTCNNLISSINVIHPQPPYSQAGCTCDAIRLYAVNNGITWNTSNPGLPALIAAKMNDDLDIPYSVTAGDVSSWILTCAATTPDMGALTSATNPNPTTGYNNVPLQFVCNTSDQQNDADFNSCNEMNMQQTLDDINYQHQLHEATEVKKHLDIFLNTYSSKCLNKLDQLEHLTAAYSLNEYYYTLYYYDQAGNLIKTVPPEGVHPITVSNTAGTGGSVTTKNVANHRASPGSNPYIWPAHALVTNYKYNTLNGIREQVTPDAGKTNFYYDAVGRLVVSQNARQAGYATQAYSYTKYDDLSRITEVGQLSNITPVTDAISKSVTDLQTWIEVPYTDKHQITRTYYDEAPAEYFSVGSTPTKAFIQSPKMKGVYAARMLGYLRNRVSFVSYSDDDFDHSLAYDAGTKYYDNATHYSYDIHGNVKTLYTENRDSELAKLGYDVNRMDYNYDLISGKVNEVSYNAGKPDQFYHRYQYDADNRITAAYTSRNGLLWEKEAKYFYYKHGPLFRTEIGDKQVQATDYAYTLQGWIKGVNGNALEAKHDIGRDGDNVMTANLNNVFARDAYGYTLGYYTGDYSAKAGSNNISFLAANSAGFNAMLSTALGDEINLTTAPEPYKDLYNGNISGMATSVYYGTTRMALTEKRLFRSFRYDQLNRIMRAHAHDDFSNNTWQSGTDGFANNYYRESFSYDFNGNIKLAKRREAYGTLVDDLEYNYTYASGNLSANKLRSVKDYDPSPMIGGIDFRDQTGYHTPTTSTPDTDPGLNYNYDKIGNLTKDQKEEIDNIDWTVYGKIKSITRVSGSTKSDLEFVYDAQGNRIIKIEKTKNWSTGVMLPASDWHVTYYMRDAQGNVMAAYKHETTPEAEILRLAEQNIYGSSRLGVVNDGMRVNGNAEINHLSQFESSFNGWGGVGTTLSIDNDQRLKVALPANTEWGGTDLYPTVQAGKTYEVSFDIDLSEVGNNSFWAIVLDYTTPWKDVNIMMPVNGHNTYRFTAWTANTIIKFQNNTATNNAYNFYLDNILIKEVTKERVLGKKQYELSNHLGNVLTTVSDRKIALEGNTVDWYYDFEDSFYNQDNTQAYAGSNSCKMVYNFSPNMQTPVYPGDVLTADIQTFYIEPMDLGATSPGLLIISLVGDDGNFLYDASGDVQWFAVGASTASDSWQPLTLNVTVPANLYTDAAHTIPYTGTIHANSHSWNPNGHEFWVDEHRLNVVHDALQVLAYAPDIRSANDYYAFGQSMPGRMFNSNQYRYGFQNQEVDQELWNGAIAFEYRIEDPRLGRFFSADPLEKDYPHNSPYAFSENVVINAVELEGLEKVDVFGNTGPFTDEHIESQANEYLQKAAEMDYQTMFWEGAEGKLSEPWERKATSIPANEVFMNPENNKMTSMHVEGIALEDNGVGSAGTVESIAPVWGSGRNAINDFQNGRYIGGTINGISAVSDVFLLKSIYSGITKGGLKALGKKYSSWSSYRSMYGKEGFAKRGQDVHHWLFEKGGSKGEGFGWWAKNQMFNLQPMEGRMINGVFHEGATIHQALHGNSSLLKFTTSQQIYYRLMYTPTWFKAGVGSMPGHINGLLNEN